MNYGKKYFKDLDLIRVIACIAVLFYHFNILEGGYLAVCTFFVLSGYLSCISGFKKEKFSLKEYYKNKLFHLYLPLVVVSFITIAIISLIPSINWLNLKPETNSVLLGYNNFWQLNANLDYFARHIDSPFMHFWYIAILLQFDLVFPFVFIFLKKLGDKFDKLIPCIITFFLSLIGIFHFYKISLDSNIMFAYYDTFARIFSIVFGLFLGFVYSYFGTLVPEKIKNSIFNKIIFYFYLICLIILLFLTKSDSPYFAITMVLATLISIRLIDYGTLFSSEKPNKILNFISNISYEIYLVQYPIIFLFQELNIEPVLKIFLMIALILSSSTLIHFALDQKREKLKILKNTLAIFVIIISLYGVYNYIVSVDHTAEMNELKEQLNQNTKLMEEQQEIYKAKLAEEQEKWDKMLSDLENGEENLKNLVSDMPVVFIGDSVMLGALPNLKAKFKNGYFNAEISRTCYVANDILKNLIKKNLLGDVIVFSFGANGDCSNATKDAILKTIGNRKLFWLTVTNDKKVHFNDKIKTYAAKYSNLYVIDWETISKGHKNYFYSDGIHLPEPGRIAYTDTIYNGIYKIYLDEYNEKKEAILNEYEEKMKTKISFYGNELLINAYEYLKDDFKDSNFVINKDFNYEELKLELLKNIEEKSLNYKVVFAFDKSFLLTESEYKEIIKICENHEVYIINLDSKFNITDENVFLINFYEYSNNNEYLMPDRIHLNSNGNMKLTQIIKEKFIN